MIDLTNLQSSEHSDMSEFAFPRRDDHADNDPDEEINAVASVPETGEISNISQEQGGNKWLRWNQKQIANVIEILADSNRNVRDCIEKLEQIKLNIRVYLPNEESVNLPSITSLTRRMEVNSNKISRKLTVVNSSSCGLRFSPIFFEKSKNTVIESCRTLLSLCNNMYQECSIFRAILPEVLDTNLENLKKHLDSSIGNLDHVLLPLQIMTNRFKKITVQPIEETNEFVDLRMEDDIIECAPDIDAYGIGASDFSNQRSVPRNRIILYARKYRLSILAICFVGLSIYALYSKTVRDELERTLGE